MLRRHKAVTAGERGALLCALTAAETAAWREEGDDAAPGVPGETRGLLLDVFGRGYPEGEAFLVDRDAVRRYRTRVLGAVAALRTHIDTLLGRANAATAA
jgi:predicted metal-dependent hydrolase